MIIQWATCGMELSVTFPNTCLVINELTPSGWCLCDRRVFIDFFVLYGLS